MKRVCQVCGKTFEGEHYARTAYKLSARPLFARVLADHAERHLLEGRGRGIVQPAALSGSVSSSASAAPRAVRCDLWAAQTPV